LGPIKTISLQLTRCHLTSSPIIWRHDKQRNDTQHNDPQNNGTQHNDTQHNDTQHNDTQHNDTQHNDKNGIMKLDVNAGCRCAECFFLLNVIMLSAIVWSVIMICTIFILSLW
jgi:hypothetical protein